MGLMKKLTSAIVASSLVFSLAGSAFAAYTPAAGETAGNRMMGLQILKGKYENDKLALKDEITRAELVTIIVRAFGKEADAALLNGAAAFPDTASHWASGNIAMAKALVEKAGGDAIGMPDGSFNPDGKLTPAQAVAFLMKFLGVKADAAKPWPANFLDKAVELNLITAEDNALIAPMLNDNATRGLVFYVFDRAFYNYDLGAGKTFYTKYVDPTAPVVTLNAVEPTTLDSKVTITGKVEGATEAYVGTKSVTLDANGNFSVDYELPELKEYSIAVTARDLAGNAAEKAVVVTRTTGNAAAIEAAAITVAAGQTVDVAAVVKDAKGNALNGVTVTGESTVGTFEAGKFTAGKTAGTGTLTLKAGEATANVDVTVTAGALATVAPSATSVKVGEQVTLNATDEFGNAIAGVTYTNDSTDALLVGGKFVASTEGTYTITGTKDGKTATATIGVYGSDVAKLVVSAPTAVVGNSLDTGATAGVQDDTDTVGTVYEVTVKAVDENGNLIGDFDGNIDLAVPAGFFAAKDDDATVADDVITKAAENGVVTFKVLAIADSIGRAYDFEATYTNADDEVIGDETAELTAATVEITEQVATSVKISTSGTAKYIRSNGSDDSTTVKVYVADQNGKKFLDTTGYTVNLSVTGAATISAAGETEEKTIEAVYSGSSIPVTFNSIQGKVGEATLTASVEGLGTATASVTAAVAEKASKFTLSADKTSAIANDYEEVTYTIQITDEKGVPVDESVILSGSFAVSQSATGELTLTSAAGEGDTYVVTAPAYDSDAKAAKFSITTDDKGYAEFTVSAAKFVGDLKLTVKDNDDAYSVGSADATVAFKADAAKQFGLTRTTQINVGAAAPTTTLSVQLYDEAGNKAAVAGKEITFSSTSDVKFNGTAKTLKVKTDDTGKATVEASVLGYVGNVYTVTVTGKDLTEVTDKDTVDIAVKNAVATKLSYSLKDAEGATVTRVTAGEVVTLTVTAKDAAGKVVGNDTESDTIYFYPNGLAYESDDTTEITKDDGIQVEWDATAGAYVLEFIPAASGSFSFTLEDSTAATALEQAGSFRVVAGAATQLVVNGGDDIKVAEGKASGAITLKLADKYGNAVASSTKTVIDITSADPVGIRTSVSAPDVQTLTIAAGASSTTFYVWNSLAADSYDVTFSVEGSTITGTVTIVVE